MLWSTAQSTHSLLCKATLRAHSHWRITNAKGTLFFEVCWLCHFRQFSYSLSPDVKYPLLGARKLVAFFAFHLNWKNSMIIKSLHHYKLHVTSLFTRILLDLLCVSRRSSFPRIDRGFHVHLMHCSQQNEYKSTIKPLKNGNAVALKTWILQRCPKIRGISFQAIFMDKLT